MGIYEAWMMIVYTPLFKCLRVDKFFFFFWKKLGQLDSMVWGCGYLGKSISGVCGLLWAEGFRDYLSVCHEGAMGKTLIKNSIIHLQSDRIAVIKYIHTIKQAFKKWIEDKVLKAALALKNISLYLQQLGSDREMIGCHDVTAVHVIHYGAWKRSGAN